MKTITPKTKSELDSAVLEAKEVLEDGGLIIYPTDTIYGIGVDATNGDVVRKVFELKGREEKKPISVIVSSFKEIGEYAEVSDFAKKLFLKFLPGPFTFLLPRRKNKLSEVAFDEEFLGVRIPDSYFCIELAQKFGKPFTTTSANISGMDMSNSIEGIVEQFKGKEELIDLIIDTGKTENMEPSTILKIDGDSVDVVREGNVVRQFTAE